MHFAVFELVYSTILSCFIYVYFSFQSGVSSHDLAGMEPEIGRSSAARGEARRGQVSLIVVSL